MFFTRRPSPQDVERFLRESSDLPLSYEPVGLAVEGRAGAGFDVDESVAAVGAGEAAFRRATGALARWDHFELGWVELLPKGAPIAPGAVVAVLVRHLGFWSLNGCRVVYSLGLDDGTEFGFDYGTLENHAESGEEIFRVSLRPDTGEVVYAIRAVSRPRAPLAKLGYPVTRLIQARFRRDSTRALARAILD